MLSFTATKIDFCNSNSMDISHYGSINHHPTKYRIGTYFLLKDVSKIPKVNTVHPHLILIQDVVSVSGGDTSSQGKKYRVNARKHSDLSLATSAIISYPNTTSCKYCWLLSRFSILLNHHLNQPMEGKSVAFPTIVCITFCA